MNFSLEEMSLTSFSRSVFEVTSQGPTLGSRSQFIIRAILHAGS